MQMHVFHVISRAEWHDAQASGWYAPASLQKFGFLHFCRESQIAFVLQRHFANRADLLVLEVDPGLVGTELRWEYSEPGQDSFPHLYGKLPVSAVLHVRHQSDFVP